MRLISVLPLLVTSYGDRRGGMVLLSPNVLFFRVYLPQRHFGNTERHALTMYSERLACCCERPRYSPNPEGRSSIFGNKTRRTVSVHHLIAVVKGSTGRGGWMDRWVVSAISVCMPVFRPTPIPDLLYFFTNARSWMVASSEDRIMHIHKLANKNSLATK